MKKLLILLTIVSVLLSCSKGECDCIVPDTYKPLPITSSTGVGWSVENNNYIVQKSTSKLHITLYNIVIDSLFLGVDYKFSFDINGVHGGVSQTYSASRDIISFYSKRGVNTVPARAGDTITFKYGVLSDIDIPFTVESIMILGGDQPLNSAAAEVKLTNK